LPPATFFHEQERADKKVAKKPLFPIFDNVRTRIMASAKFPNLRTSICIKVKVMIVMRITCPDSYPGIIQYLKIIFCSFILAV